MKGLGQNPRFHMLYWTNNSSVFQPCCKKWVKKAPSPSSVPPNNMFEWNWNSSKPSSSRPNFAGIGPIVYDSFHWKQAIVGENVPFFVKQIQIWHLLQAWPFILFGLSASTRCLTKNNGTNPRSNTLFGTTSLCMPRWRGRGWVKYVKIVYIQLFLIRLIKYKHTQSIWMCTNPCVSRRRQLKCYFGNYK